MKTEEIKLTKKERKVLIGKISRASGIAQYALTEKITDVDILILSQHLEILSLVKSANTYNRHCQAKKTEEANNKLKEFINLENSEILKTGQWLLNALSKSGKERKTHLLEKNLVHKDDYNDAVTDLTDVIKEHNLTAQQQVELATETIKQLQQKNDLLRRQLIAIENYINSNYGSNTWTNIKQKLIRNQR